MRGPAHVLVPIALLAVLLLQPPPVGADALSDIETEFEKAIRNVSPSTVVCVPAGVKASQTKRPSSSSGIIISRKGFVLSDGDVGVWTELSGKGKDRKATRHDSDTIEVRLPDLKGRGSRSYEAKVIVRERKHDTSLLRITKPPSGLKHLAVANSDKLHVGDFAFSMGDSFGLAAEAPPTLTAGLITALVPAEDKSRGLYELIYTSAAVNVGVNGGPLVDIEGRLVGVISGPETPWDPKTGDANRPFQFLGRVVPIQRLKAFYREFPEAADIFDDASADRPRSRKAAILETVFHETAKRAYRGLVSLEIKRKGGAEFKNLYAFGRRGLGKLPRYSGPVSGILISNDGYMLTSIYNLTNTVGIMRALPPNAPADAKFGHGLGLIETIVAHMPDGREAEAEIIGRHDGIGVVLLKTKRAAGDAEARVYGTKLLEPVPEDFYEAGRMVLGIAHPFGKQRHADPMLTYGILSKQHGEDAADRWAGQWQTDCSGTDATAGGAVVDLRGRLVGMHHIWDPGRHGRNSGISFVVPWPQIASVLEDLKQGRVFSPPLIGVNWQPADGGGLQVMSVVAEGPASKAGVKPKDIIVKLNGHEVNDIGEAVMQLKGKWSGDVITLTIRRGEETLELEVTLGSRVG